VGWDAPGNAVFFSSIDIQLNGDISFDHVDISVDNNDTYELLVLVDKDWVPVTQILPNWGGGMARHVIQLPEKTPPTSTIRVTALAGDGMYSVGHLIIR
jgi:hypothetical protein